MMHNFNKKFIKNNKKFPRGRVEKASDFDAETGSESPVRAPARAATLCTLCVMACVFVAGTAQKPESVSGQSEPCPIQSDTLTFG